MKFAIQIYGKFQTKNGSCPHQRRRVYSLSDSSILLENATQVVNPSEISTRPMPSCSNWSPPFNKPNSISPFWLHYWHTLHIWLCYLFLSWCTLPVGCVRRRIDLTYSNKVIGNIDSREMKHGLTMQIMVNKRIDLFNMSQIFVTYSWNRTIWKGDHQCGSVITVFHIYCRLFYSREWRRLDMYTHATASITVALFFQQNPWMSSTVLYVKISYCKWREQMLVEPGPNWYRM